MTLGNVVSLYIVLTVPEDGFGQGAGQVALAHFVDAVRGVLTNGAQCLRPLGRVPKAGSP